MSTRRGGRGRPRKSPRRRRGSGSGGPGGRSTPPMTKGAAGDGGNAVCHDCGRAINSAQFIRAGEYRFHMEHFVCHACRTPLKDNKFHHRQGQFYCHKDFVELFCHTCRHCSEKIMGGNVVQAFGHYYHPEHFVCYECEKPFHSGQYFEHDGHPYCEEHFLYHTAEFCVQCGKPILEEADTVRVNGEVYHSNCLVCFQCAAPLGGDESIFQKDGNVYCRTDYYNFFARRCAACGEHITKQCISVNEEYYHPDCLKCFVCETPLDQYVSLQGTLRCEAHAELDLPDIYCDVCDEQITALDSMPPDGDEDVEYIVMCVGKRVHGYCFQCQYCKADLEKPTARLLNNLLACTTCLSRGGTAGLTPVATSRSKTPTHDPSASAPIVAPRPEGSTPGHISAFDDDASSGGSPSPPPPPPPSGPASPPFSASGPFYDENGRLLDPQDPIDQIWIENILLEHGLDPAEVFKTLSDPGTGETPPADPGSAPDASPSSQTKKKKGGPKRPGHHKSKTAPHSHEPKIDWQKGDVIGQGAYGKVFCAMNRLTGDLIAVKQVKLNTVEKQEEARSIEEEVRLLRHLDHPNIVNLLGTENTGDKLNILMEYVPGKSLDLMIAQFGALNETVVCNFTFQLLRGLEYCHRNNVVHRDIKAKNVLVDTQRNVKLCDFGSAKRFDDIMMKDAPSISFNYTPLWTAPEVLRDEYNSKVDIWSLGCVVIEMATGNPPWHEKNFSHPFRALYHIGNSNEVPQIPPNLSPQGQDFVRLCLTRDPDKRPGAFELLQHPWVRDEAVKYEDT